MAKEPVEKEAEKITVENNFLESVTGDMPSVSPAAETIAQKVQNEKQEQNPTPEPKKRGRKPGQKNGTGKANISPQSRLGGMADAGERDNIIEAAQRVAAASFIVDCMEMSGVALAAEAGRMNEKEKPVLVAIWDKYLEQKDISDIPPGVMLTVMCGQYYARVLVSEQARPATNKIKEKIGGLFGKLFVRFKNARSMRGNDRMRENDTGETIGTRLQTPGN